MEKIRAIICDDDENIVSSVQLSLGQHGIDVDSSPPDRILVVLEGGYDVLLLDVYLGKWNGLDILQKVHEMFPGFPVVMISGLAEMEEAVEAIRLGAFDFIEKPLKPERLLVSVRNAARLARMKKERFREPFIYASAAMKTLTDKARKVAVTGSTVLIQGESGTGKEVLAKYIHANSPRTDKQLVKLNCGAIPETLIESELFGHKRGAFTGADRDYGGKIQAADGGTIFLDEIGELPPQVQIKLLRFIESREIQRVGDERIGKIDARIIAATNRDLEHAVTDGVFREDLFYRLNVFPLTLPPLRDRRDEIIPLAEHFIEEIAAAMGLSMPTLSPDAAEALKQMDFPGNVRELRALMERLIILSGGMTISAESLRDAARVRRDIGKDDIFDTTMPLSEAKKKLEKYYIETQLAKHDGSVQNTAAALDILPNNLSRRIKQLEE